jgi:hypothetical protein
MLGGFQNLRKTTRHNIDTKEERMAGSSTPI